MLYLVDRTSRIPSIKSALQAAGVITTIFYEAATSIVFSTPRSNKVIKVMDNSAVYFGDAWTSTTVITNEVAIMSTSIDPYDWAIVVTPDLLTFIAKGGSAANGDCFCTSFAKSVDATKNLVIGGSSINSSAYRQACWDTTGTGTGIQLKPAVFGINESAVDGSGFFYTMDYYLKTISGNVVYPSPVKGLKIVLNGILSTSQGFQKFGNDIVGHGRYTNYNTGIEMGANFLLTNGMI